MTKPQYINSCPKDSTLHTWKRPIANHLQKSGTEFNRKFDKIARQVYKDLSETYKYKEMEKNTRPKPNTNKTR